MPAGADGDGFAEADGLRWHLRRGGHGSRRLLLVHGTGASAHSFDGLVLWLGDGFEWLAPDLPGHGDTGRASPAQLSIGGMAMALDALLRALGWAPDAAIGHSAGAALLVRMALDGAIAPRALVAVNGAFLPFGGWAAPLFSPLARLLYRQTWVPRLFARRAADPRVVRRLVEGTGSRLPDDRIAAYQRLITRPGQAEAALGMMAHWDLQALARDLPRLAVPLWLLVGSRDRAVPPAQAQQVVQRCSQARIVVLPGLGHLAHEEDPAAVGAALQAPFSTIGAPGPARV